MLFCKIQVSTDYERLISSVKLLGLSGLWGDWWSMAHRIHWRWTLCSFHFFLRFHWKIPLFRESGSNLDKSGSSLDKSGSNLEKTDSNLEKTDSNLGRVR